VVFVVVVLVVG
jgi:hypothetical protein